MNPLDDGVVDTLGLVSTMAALYSSQTSTLAHLVARSNASEIRPIRT
jgi:hypothetical protein